MNERSDLRSGKTEEAVKRIPITNEACEAVTEISPMTRNGLGGYKPDVSLVVSALSVNSRNHLDASKEVIKAHAKILFQKMSSKEVGGQPIADQAFSRNLGVSNADTFRLTGWSPRPLPLEFTNTA